MRVDTHHSSDGGHSGDRESSLVGHGNQHGPATSQRDAGFLVTLESTDSVVTYIAPRTAQVPLGMLRRRAGACLQSQHGGAGLRPCLQGRWCQGCHPTEPPPAAPRGHKRQGQQRAGTEEHGRSETALLCRRRRRPSVHLCGVSSDLEGTHHPLRSGDTAISSGVVGCRIARFVARASPHSAVVTIDRCDCPVGPFLTYSTTPPLRPPHPPHSPHRYPCFPSLILFPHPPLYSIPPPPPASSRAFYPPSHPDPDLRYSLVQSYTHYPYSPHPSPPPPPAGHITSRLWRNPPTLSRLLLLWELLDRRRRGCAGAVSSLDAAVPSNPLAPALGAICRSFTKRIGRPEK